MKRLTYLALFSVLVLSAGARAFATDVSGAQSGTWTLDQSPYELVGDVYVPAGETLIIEPGVVVNALGHYKLTVNQATLRAVGTAAQPILMTAEDQATGWRGIRMDQADDSSVVSYCIIEYAKGTGAYPGVRGGAIYCKNCSPTISHNELRFNYSHNSSLNGTGAGVTTESSHALIMNNHVHDNIADSGGGICCLEYGTPVVTGNVITDNTAYNGGGGIYMGARSSPLIEKNLIMHNSSGGWGGGGINSWTSYIYYSTFATIRSNVIAQNVNTSSGDARGGGGIYCRYDKAVIHNNVIADNQASRGGGIYALNYPAQAPDVVNCIVWGNTASAGAQIYVYSGTGSAISVTFSDVEGGWSGYGVIDEDPLFVDPAGDDYHLSAPSPCIDMGNNYVCLPGQTDIDGQMRIWDGDGDDVAVVEMGADEFGSFAYGDLNCDGLVNAFDIDPFVLALTDPAGYDAAHPDCELLLADCNGDGAVDAFDIDPFVELLTGG